MKIEKLPPKIKDLPHWRVNFRPNKYEMQMEQDPSAAFDLMQQASVRLGGWNYPHIGRELNEQIREEKYIASGCDWGDIIEYWRLYYSSQFIHLFATWERTDEKLKKHTLNWVLRSEKVDDIPGFIKISNILFILTKVFEFAARLCEKTLYKHNLEITVSLENINHFVLTADASNLWHGCYPATRESIKKEWKGEVPELLAKCNEISLEGMIYFYKQFGWDGPSTDILREQQNKFLSKTPRRG